ncbi:MAG: histone deacetylase family protein [Bosea sp.]|jgi:acetoin utilization deacetylase AcuC-like enzyme|nr:histone deacetylase family protein [Bosea sp. (in: a-proteobacteria)]
MKLFFSPDQLLHRPQQYFRFGKIGAAVENPSRMETLAGSLAGLGLDRVEPEDHGREPILAVHDAAYLDFLERIWGLWTQLPDAGPEVLPNIHPYRGAGPDLFRADRPRNTGAIGLAGFHIGDMSCAMGPGTFASAYASAQAAISGAKALLAGDRRALALCRPPGHHCYRDRANGFCFLNNAAIAAELLRERFGKVAILDFDTHHGDGTQAIFYARGDVLVASCHTDPTDYYPFFAGHADERGHGAGEGANLNITLSPGVGDAAYLEAAQGLAKAVQAFGAEALIVSAGWDAHRDDPLSRLTVTSEAYPRLGAMMAGLGLPTLIVQEGGYSLAAIADAAPSFITAFLGGHR